MIVDSQVHLWRPETSEQPWAPGAAAHAHLPYAFTYEMMLTAMDEAGVDRVIIVPPSWQGEGNEYALEAARKFPRRFGVMGRLRLDSPVSRSLLRNWHDQPGMLGIRLTFTRGREYDWLYDGTADWIWPAAQESGIPVMINAAESKAKLSQIAKSHPRLKMVIDHMGISIATAKAGRIDEAVAETIGLAQYENVHVKLSAAPSYSSEHYPFRDMLPRLKRLVTAFGPRRCFWGTDLTQTISRYTYRQHVEHFTKELGFLSEADLSLIMGGSILDCLKWPVNDGI